MGRDAVAGSVLLELVLGYILCWAFHDVVNVFRSWVIVNVKILKVSADTALSNSKGSVGRAPSWRGAK